MDEISLDHTCLTVKDLATTTSGFRSSNEVYFDMWVVFPIEKSVNDLSLSVQQQLKLYSMCKIICYFRTFALPFHRGRNTSFRAYLSSTSDGHYRQEYVEGKKMNRLFEIGFGLKRIDIPDHYSFQYTPSESYADTYKLSDKVSILIKNLIPHLLIQNNLGTVLREAD